MAYNYATDGENLRVRPGPRGWDITGLSKIEVKLRKNLHTLTAVVVPKCFIKHMCFIVLYFHGHAFFSLVIAKKCFFVLYFLKNVLYFCKLFKWVEHLFQVFIYNTKIGEP